MAQPTKSQAPKGCCFGSLGIIVLVALMLLVRGGGHQQEAGLSPGADGVLRNPDGLPVVLANDQATLEAYTAAFEARDKARVNQIVAAGQLFSVPSETKCVVRERAQGSRRVEITEGDRAGDLGWVSIQWVRPPR